MAAGRARHRRCRARRRAGRVRDFGGPPVPDLRCGVRPGTEGSVGSIEVGKAGDLVVLSADPTRVPSSEIADVEVLATVVDGQVEYCGPGVPPDLAPLCPYLTATPEP